ncbi:MAG: hypothetical protein PHQ59_03385 [Candidatus Daviesbacteria bacterium]|nr:hypothetical protein [Candidatus Daviesbacteria bacterium]
MNKYKFFIILILVIMATFGVYNNTLAESSTESAVKAEKLTQKEEVLRNKTELEINRRLTSLSNLNTRVEAMKKLSNESKNTLILQVQDQINSLNALKLKIQNDSDIQSFKDDRLAITEEYRIYLLFIPKMHILAASDRIFEITADMDKLVSKMQTRIDSEKKKGKDITTMQSNLDNIKSKITDANTQAKAATDLVTLLVPDQGNKSKFAANKQALQDARKKLVLAKQDLSLVKQGFEQIRQDLNPSSSSSATPSAIKTKLR